MTRVLCVCSEPLGQRVAGIGLRYVQLTKQLADADFEVSLLAPSTRAQSSTAVADDRIRCLELQTESLKSSIDDADVVVGQGQLMNDVALAGPAKPIVVDLYDPWLIENFRYLDSLGLDPYRNDHASWVLQMRRGDFFLCSSEEQRLFYLGFLAALGRVNPLLADRDPDLRSLIDTVPFGLPLEAPGHQPWLPERAPGERRILFGGVYDWYDPWTLLEAFEGLARKEWKLLFVRNPRSETPQRLLGEIERWAQRRQLLGSRVELLEWVPFERRYDLLRDVDVLVAPHGTTLESRLSMRTRFLDALLVGCPAITSELGTVARLLRERRAGWVVPVGDAAALGVALDEALEGTEREERVARGRQLATELSWRATLEPLVRFCRAPRVDPEKEAFCFRAETVAPPDPLSFRVRRKLRRWLEGGR